MGSESDRDIPREDEDAERDDAEGASRRDVLATLGRFAYVAPALTLLAEPGLAHAAYGSGNQNNNNNNNGNSGHGH